MFKKLLNISLSLWKKHVWLATLIVFLAVFAVSSFFYLNTSKDGNVGIYLDDHFFNIKYAYLLRTEGFDISKNFKWNYFAFPHTDQSPVQGKKHGTSLFNIALIPFTYIKDLLLALQISDIFWGSFATAFFYYLMRQLFKVKYPLFWTLLLFSSSFFIQRIFLSRAFILTTILILLETHLAVRKKYLKLFLTGIFHISWHNTTFFMPLLVVFIVEIARYLSSQKFSWKTILVGISSILASMAFLPKFPLNIWILIKGIFSVQKSLTEVSVNVAGMELYTKDIFRYFFLNYQPFLFLFLINIGLTIYYYILSKKKTQLEKNSLEIEKMTLIYAGFLFNIIFVSASLFISGRFYDFYFPITVFLSALFVTKLFQEKKIKIEKPIFIPTASASLIFCLALSYAGIFKDYEKISKQDQKPMIEATQWIEENSEPGEIVFLENWSHFTIAFFTNHKNYYTMGMEPNLLLKYHPELYWKWLNIAYYEYYCDQPKDCFEQKNKLYEKLSELDQEKQDEFLEKNAKRIIESVKNDFQSRFILSEFSSKLPPILDLQPDLIEEKITFGSKTNPKIYATVYKLK